MSKSKYLSTKETKKLINVHTHTLYNWERRGLIETIRTKTGRRLYNVNKYLKNINKIERLNICYIRVSTIGQKDDLLRQRKFMETKYPDYQVVQDIGSGINFNRKGLTKIIDYALEGKINKLVVVHKDRLTRFGFELIERIIKKYLNGKIIVDSKDKKKEAREELVEDVLQILNVYTAKMNGLRKYNKL